MWGAGRLSGMDAQPELSLLAKALNQHGLEAVLIGNMAAALHGAPVSTVDTDLFFRKTPRNMQKLKLVAETLGAVILRPYYPVSGLFRMQRERDEPKCISSGDSVCWRPRWRTSSLTAGGHSYPRPEAR